MQPLARNYPQAFTEFDSVRIIAAMILNENDSER
jgi:hypothetical protein